MTPVLRGFTQQGCVTPESIINAPTTAKEKIASNDILASSKYLKLLDHVGPAFNLEQKKQILRDIEIAKKTVVRGGRNSTAKCVLRNFTKVSKAAE